MPARPLIPRRKLFDNPTFFGAKLSPDGRFISWLAPVDGVLNVWVSPSEDIAAGRPVTQTKGRPINWQDWSPGGRQIMFLNDENGDENLHLFVANPHTAELRDLTPFAKTRVELVRWSHIVPDKIAIRMNDRDARWFDVFLLDLVTGKRALVWENHQQFGRVFVDWQLRLRLAMSDLPDGGKRLWRIDAGGVTPWRDIGFEARWYTEPVCFDAAGKHLFMLSNLDHDKSALIQVEWPTGVQEVLFADDRADVSQLILRSACPGRPSASRARATTTIAGSS